MGKRGIYVALDTKSLSGQPMAKATPVEIAEPSEKIRNLDHNDPVGRLCLTAYCDEKDGHWFGWGVEAQASEGLTADQMAPIVKMLRAVERKIARYRDEYGPTATFGGFLQRVGRAIGAECIAYLDGPSRGWAYDDNAHRIIALKDAAYFVDAKLTEAAETMLQRNGQVAV